MRIEMATATGMKTKFVQELPQLINVIYGKQPPRPHNK
jgi:lipopolysaccharide/colanic/teichoic acid biosynthesis glycosyltransferase